MDLSGKQRNDLNNEVNGASTLPPFIDKQKGSNRKGPYKGLVKCG